MAKDATGGRERAGKRQIAVALSFEPTHASDAPKVVASGKGELARKILDAAFEHGVKVREDADLAEVLSAVDIDSVIPSEAFIAVAEILSYVYRVNRRQLPSISELPP